MAKIKHFTISVKTPFRLDLTVWALKRRERNIVDLWENGQYIRVLCLHNTSVKVEVTQISPSRISVTTKSSRLIPQKEIVSILTQMLGLKIDMKPFYARMKKEKALYPLAKQFRGVKPPRFPSLFETLSNAICCQQLSLEAGLTLLNHLIEKYGKPFREKNRVLYAFPTPQRIQKCRPQELRALGFSLNKSRALIGIAALLAHGEETFDLYHLKGIGRWSQEYTLLRGLGKTDILPGDDVGIHKSVKALLHLRKTVDYDKVKELEKKWHPYAGMIYFHLLLNKLAKQGVVS